MDPQIPPAPDLRPKTVASHHFAILAGLEACVRGTLISTIPVAVYDAFGTAQNLSGVYFLAGVITLTWGLLVPRMTQIFPRRFVYMTGCLMYLAAMMLFVQGTALTVQTAIIMMSMATVTCFVCFNAYVLDYVPRSELGQTQSLQMLFAAAPWAIGPMSGVWMREFWDPLPFIVAGVFAVIQLGAFVWLRLGDGRQISRAKRPAVNPLAYLGKFARDPRLVSGWLYAVLRSCGWWVYVVYLPIFCIENGLGDKLGGTVMSVSNALLLTSPFMAAWVRRVTVRRAMIWSTGYAAIAFLLATLLSPWPLVAVAVLFIASFALVMLDVAGGLPFMMAVKPSERAEMAAVYSSFRDVSSIMTPGVAWLVLWVAPLPAIFAASGLGFAAAFGMARHLHPRLGLPRPSRGGG